MTINVEELVSRKTSRTYPNIEVSYSRTLPLLTTDLEKGDMQVILDYNGKLKCVCNISGSARNVKLLLDCTGNIVYNKSPEESYNIQSVQEYLDLV